MSAVPQPVYVDFVRIDCYKCAMPFWVPSYFDRERLAKHDTFYCPAGHNQAYVGPSEADRLRKLLEEANRRNTTLASDLTREQEEKRKLDRKLKRVGRGVCPECNRTFSNLARHMECKHAKPGAL